MAVKMHQFNVCCFLNVALVSGFEVTVRFSLPFLYSPTSHISDRLSGELLYARYTNI